MIIRTLFKVLLVVLPISAAFAQDEFQRGMLWEDNRYNSLPLHYGTNNALPSSKSLKPFFPRVVIQPSSDFTDTGWAAAWYARTATEAIACNQKDPAKIVASAFSPTYNYGLVRKGHDCFEAVSLIDVLESMTKNGTPYFSEFRDMSPSEIPRDLYSIASGKKLSGYFRLFNTSDDMNVKVQSVKNALISNNPVVAGMICPPSFHFAKDFWQPREPEVSQHYGGHTIAIVGYDDSKFGGAFEVVNTWGKEWGVQGFSWIRYKDFADWVPYSFALFQVGSASCKIAFDGRVAFTTLDGDAMNVTSIGNEGEFKFVTSYPSGTTFTIHMSSNLPAYVYSFAIDPGNSFFPLFPRDATTTPITFSTLRAPDDMPALTLTDPAGKNSVYFIFSPNAIDLQKVIKKLKGKKAVSTFDVRLALESGDAPVVKWNEKSLGFTGNLSTPVVMHVVLDQIRKVKNAD